MAQPGLRYHLQGKEEAEVFLKNCSALKGKVLWLSGCHSKKNKSEGSTRLRTQHFEHCWKNVVEDVNQKFSENRQSLNSCSLCQAIPQLCGAGQCRVWVPSAWQEPHCTVGTGALHWQKGFCPATRKDNQGTFVSPKNCSLPQILLLQSLQLELATAPACHLSLQCLQRNAFSSETVLIVCFSWQKIHALLDHDSSYLPLLEEKDYFLVR